MMNDIINLCHQTLSSLTINNTISNKDDAIIALAENTQILKEIKATKQVLNLEIKKTNKAFNLKKKSIPKSENKNIEKKKLIIDRNSQLKPIKRLKALFDLKRNQTELSILSIIHKYPDLETKVFPNKEKYSNLEQGEATIDKIGHRRYVGGVGKNWFEIGHLQFKFLISRGLQPQHKFLDIACGPLRAGLFIIPYLETGNYLGIEKEPKLIDAGVEIELGQELNAIKKPKFVLSSTFEFGKFNQQPDYAIAQSLFTHLPPDMIHDCFKKLYPVMAKGGKFYATFFQSKDKIENPDKPHDRLGYWFTKEDIVGFGENNGWEVNYIGDWEHPRNQIIVEYTKQ